MTDKLQSLLLAAEKANDKSGSYDYAEAQWIGEMYQSETEPELILAVVKGYLLMKEALEKIEDLLPVNERDRRTISREAMKAADELLEGIE